MQATLNTFREFHRVIDSDSYGVRLHETPCRTAQRQSCDSASRYAGKRVIGEDVMHVHYPMPRRAKEANIGEVAVPRKY